MANLLPLPSLALPVRPHVAAAALDPVSQEDTGMAHKAPGESFREGISLVRILRMFPDDATAEAWFVARRWPTAIACPHPDFRVISCYGSGPGQVG